jgi:hypothetical protein
MYSKQARAFTDHHRIASTAPCIDCQDDGGGTRVAKEARTFMPAQAAVLSGSPRPAPIALSEQWQLGGQERLCHNERQCGGV